MAALQISRKVDYALRAVVHLAGQDGDRGCTLVDIAAHVDVSPQFLAKIVEQLAHRGLVRSRRGPNGGYVIGRPLTEVSIYDVMDAVEGPIALNKCLVGSDECSRHPNCGMTSVWKEAQDRLVDVLANTTLADIQRRRRPARKRHARPPSS